MMDGIYDQRIGSVAYFFVILAGMLFLPVSEVYGTQFIDFAAHTSQTNILAELHVSRNPNFSVAALDSSPNRKKQTFRENNRVSQSSADSSHDSLDGFDVQKRTVSFFQGNVIGWLFFGQPYEGFGVVDIFFIAVILVIIMKSVKRLNSYEDPLAENKGKNSQAYGMEREKDNGYVDGSPFKKPVQSIDVKSDPEKAEMKKRASSAWDALRSSPARQSIEGYESSTGYREGSQQGFDERGFLEGAKVFYSRLQYSWAARDLDDLVPFTTKEMMDSLKEQALHDPEPSSVEVLLVNASLAGVSQDEKEEKAKVLFSALIQEKKDEAPFDVKELWHFTHGFDADITWRLDAIEPVN